MAWDVARAELWRWVGERAIQIDTHTDTYTDTDTDTQHVQTSYCCRTDVSGPSVVGPFVRFVAKTLCRQRTGQLRASRHRGSVRRHVERPVLLLHEQNSEERVAGAACGSSGAGDCRNCRNCRNCRDGRDARRGGGGDRGGGDRAVRNRRPGGRGRAGGRLQRGNGRDQLGLPLSRRNGARPLRRGLQGSVLVLRLLEGGA